MAQVPWAMGEQGEIADRLQHLSQSDGGAPAAAGGSAPDQDVPPSDGGASEPGGSTSPAAPEAHAPPSPTDLFPSILQPDPAVALREQLGEVPAGSAAAQMMSTPSSPNSGHVAGQDHVYLSTACYHGHCEHCQCRTNIDGGPKEPGQCKFCPARCVHDCHTRPTTEPAAPVRPLALHRERLIEVLKPYLGYDDQEPTRTRLAAHVADAVLATAVDLDSDDVIARIRLAISDPGSVVKRDRDSHESVSQWSTRAVRAALRNLAGGAKP